MDATGTLEVLEAHGHWVAVGWGEEFLRGRFIPAYVITTDTGFRAAFEACPAGECAAQGRTPCPIPVHDREHAQHPVNGRSGYEAWRKHERTHCHRWHEASVMTMARRVLATYGRRRPN